MLNMNCPICDTKKHSKVTYKSNLEKDLDNINYAGRKKPDGFHYEMLRCDKCSLLYASQVYENDFTEKLYIKSDFDYKSEIHGLKKTYGNCLFEAERLLKNKENFLEIGCGNGFVLELAKNNGWKNLMGVEPSLKAIENANPNIKNNIFNGIFNVDNYQKDYFDIIFVAMLIEHIPDINKFLNDIYKLLKPGGTFITICHNESHFLSKLFKNKHPIVNDEHNYIFSPKTINKIYKKHHFKNIKVKNLKNYYSIGYWLKMMPYKFYFLKNFLFKNLLKTNVGFKAGNLFVISNK